ncbi:MAG: hypothetical protein ABIJ08_00150 [Nanoarchaeota archaeon]
MLKNLEYAVQNPGQYRDSANNGIYIWVHPSWGVFAQKKRPYRYSGDIVEDTIKKQLLSIGSAQSEKDILYLYATALHYLNERIFLSSISDTSSLCLLALPKDHDHKRQEKIADEKRYWNFPEEFARYLEGFDPAKFISVETTEFYRGSIDNANVEMIDKLSFDIGIDKGFIFGGNVGECLSEFIASTRNVISLTAVADLCHVPGKFYDHDGRYRDFFPNGEYWIWFAEAIFDLHKTLRYISPRIKSASFDDLKGILYSLNTLNKKLSFTNNLFWQIYGDNPKEGIPHNIKEAVELDHLPAVRRFLDLRGE